MDMPASVLFPLMLIRSAGLPLSRLDLPDSGFETAVAAWQETRSPLEKARLGLYAFELEREKSPLTPLDKLVMNQRRRLIKMQRAGLSLPQPLPLALKETRPDLFGYLHDWNEALANHTQAFLDMQQQYEQRLHRQYRQLQALAGDETMCRGLLFASHDLLQRLPHFAGKPVSEFNKKDRQTARSLWQYATRAAVKTSPLSRFTTVSLLRWEHPVPEYFAQMKAIATPNVALLPALYEVLLRHPDFYTSLKIRLNPCIISPEGTAEKGLEWLYFDGEQEGFQSLQPDAVTHLVMGALLEEGRQMPYPALLSILLEAVDADTGALEHFLQKLIDMGLLEWVLPEVGLSAGWCGSLYQYLGFLPAESPIVEAAALLQWLRTAARTLSFQDVDTARQTQVETLQTARDFFDRFGGTMPPIPPEQVFFEDVDQPVEALIPPEVLRDIAEELADAWQARRECRQPAFKAALTRFAENQMAEGESLDFLTFSKKYLQSKLHKTDISEPVYAPKFKGKIGALLQIFRENGRWRATVNALFPGGGKLFARWLHLFPAEVREQLRDWQDSGENAPWTFPWQGWNNANFQAQAVAATIAVPDSKLSAREQVLPAAVQVKRSREGLQLCDASSGRHIHLSDLGLEAPQSRPPAMQVLRQLGVPYVSMDALLPEKRAWAEEQEHWSRRPRLEQGALVLARAQWFLKPALIARLSALHDLEFLLQVREIFAAMQAPRHFFARFAETKPQYVDCNNPVSMQQFEKMLRSGQGALWLTEMLPLPEQCFVEKDGLRAAEFVLELEV